MESRVVERRQFQQQNQCMQQRKQARQQQLLLLLQGVVYRWVSLQLVYSRQPAERLSIRARTVCPSSSPLQVSSDKTSLLWGVRYIMPSTAAAVSPVVWQDTTAAAALLQLYFAAASYKL